MSEETIATEDVEEEELELNDTDLFEFWCNEIKAYETKSKRWREDAKRVIRRYRNESAATEGSTDHLRPQFNILWSNIQTIQPATYSRTPKPEVERRFKDQDPLARGAAEMLERSIEYSVDSYPFDETMVSADIDFLLTGRGCAWARYVPYLNEETGLLDYEEVVCDYLHHEDFLHEPARRWEEVTWVGKKAYLSKKQFKKRFPKADYNEEEFNQVPDTNTDSALKGEEVSNRRRKILVTEIWDKDRKEVFWLSPNSKSKTFLDRKKDPLGLRKFFPCPKPMFGTMTNDSCFPVSDYSEYESLAQELDEITARITDLTNAVKAGGIYDASLTELENLLSSRGNIMIPAQNYAAVIGVGGVSGAITWYPLDTIVKALQILQQMRNEKLQQIYEVSGMSDIIRGASNPNETATAQQIKGQFATLRLSQKQQEVQRFAKDLYELKGEIIAEHFSPETIALISNSDILDPTVQEAILLLKEDKLRTYKINIETDSTIAIDEQLEKQKRTEWLESVGAFIQQTMTIAQMLPSLTPALLDMVLFTTRTFKAGRTLEEPLEAAFDQVKQQVFEQIEMQRQQAQQGPPPDPNMMRVQQDGQIAQARLQMESQTQSARLQMEAQESARKANLEIQELQAKHEREVYKITKDFELKALELQNTPLKAETQNTVQEATPAQTAPPIHVNVNVSNAKKKRATMVTDPATGVSTAVVEDVPEVEVTPVEVGL